MQRPDWREPSAYTFYMDLSAAAWAWQFLRRNSQYQTDWEWFTRTWQSLEQDYGSPPHRDFTRWRQDPRAYRKSSTAGVDDEEPLLIECWMGLKWGYYKFPLDPAMDFPELGKVLLWREVETVPPVLDSSNMDYLAADPAQVALGFDLRLPLQEQLESAKRILVGLRHKLRSAERTGRSAGNPPESWLLMLRLLDAESCGATLEEISHLLQRSQESCQLHLQQAQQLVCGGYRQMLLQQL